MGSAAARHLSVLDDGVALIGPAEPADQTAHDGVFASHYDQGRLTTRLSKDVTWSRLARHAMAGYRALEQAAGIDFYRPVGRVAAEAAYSPKPERAAALDIAAAEEIPFTLYAPEDRRWRLQFPALDFPDGFGVLVEPDPAGYINPRAMLQAQLTLAERQGTAVIRETVVDVRERAAGVTVQTDSGGQYHAERLLVAAGAFTNFNRLLPRPIPLKVKTETIILGRVSPETAAALADMPVVTYQIADPAIDDIYMTPPMRYPDGEFYVKMGCNTRADTWPTSLEAVQTWFRTGNSDACQPAMAAAMQSLLPQVEFLGMTTKRCIVCYTPSGLPTIDQVSERIYVAAGGNGSGAKGSDTLGRLAAGLVYDGRWPEEFPRAPFQRDSG